jgi:hypothetical protein
MLLVAGVHKEFRSAARQVYALEAARLSFMAHATDLAPTSSSSEV